MSYDKKRVSLRSITLCLLFAGLLLSGCDSSTDDISSNDDELLGLVDKLNSPGELLVTSGSSDFISLFEPSREGRLSDGVHWGFLSEDDTHTLYLGMAFGNGKVSAVNAPSDCTLESGGGWLKQRRFAKCVRALHEKCDGAWTWTDEDGNTYADGKNFEDGHMVDC